MTVRCASCGEEMLGAVNRCWQCGNLLVANAAEPDLPPQRRPVEAPAVVAPVVAASHAQVTDAEVLEDGSDTVAIATEEHGSGDEENAGDMPPVRETPMPELAPTESLPQGPPSAPVTEAGTEYRHPRHHPTAATGGALGSLLLGAISLVVSWFTVLGALLSICGLGLGAWGASSNRRETAIVGMLLCSLALLISGYTGAIAAYVQIYGYSPWESSMPAEFIDSQPGDDFAP